jgi:hypothetical protein
MRTVRNNGQLTEAWWEQKVEPQDPELRSLKYNMGRKQSLRVSFCQTSYFHHTVIVTK